MFAVSYLLTLQEYLLSSDDGLLLAGDKARTYNLKHPSIIAASYVVIVNYIHFYLLSNIFWPDI